MTEYAKDKILECIAEARARLQDQLGSRESSLAITKLDEAEMWVGRIKLEGEFEGDIDDDDDDDDDR